MADDNQENSTPTTDESNVGNVPSTSTVIGVSTETTADAGSVSNTAASTVETDPEPQAATIAIVAAAAESGSTPATTGVSAAAAITDEQVTLFGKIQALAARVSSAVELRTLEDVMAALAAITSRAGDLGKDVSADIAAIKAEHHIS